jgi:hypothetical protein
MLKLQRRILGDNKMVRVNIECFLTFNYMFPHLTGLKFKIPCVCLKEKLRVQEKKYRTYRQTFCFISPVVSGDGLSLLVVQNQFHQFVSCKG